MATRQPPSQNDSIRTFISESEMCCGFSIPSDYQGCHTILMEGYAIEGHVSVELIRKLLKEHPADVIGITIPGMPPDVPGMNSLSRDEPVTVYAIKADGTASVFGTQ
jgi:hypothetical protein